MNPLIVCMAAHVAKMHAGRVQASDAARGVRALLHVGWTPHETPRSWHHRPDGAAVHVCPCMRLLQTMQRDLAIGRVRDGASAYLWACRRGLRAGSGCLVSLRACAAHAVGAAFSHQPVGVVFGVVATPAGCG